eukprot:441430_1
MSVLGKHNREDTELPPTKKQKPNNNVNNNTNNSDDNKEEKGLTLEPQADANLHQIIVLDVGGVKYKTTLQTITCYNSILKSRFSGSFSLRPNQDGSHFIDRNGKLFEYILEYFRTGQLLLPKWNKQDIWKFYIEVNYYMIRSLFRPILLKLFDSKLITNLSVKMQLINKLNTEIFDHNSIDKTLENLKTWKLVYEYDLIQFSKERIGDDLSNELFGRQIKNHLQNVNFMHDLIGHSLVLIQSTYKIYGLFLTYRDEIGITFANCFAFDCGENSAHLDPEQKTEITFRDVRRPTTEEKTFDKNEAYEDVPFLDWYPIFVTTFKPNFMRFCGILRFKYFKANLSPDECCDENVTKMEIWSIPL